MKNAVFIFSILFHLSVFGQKQIDIFQSYYRISPGNQSSFAENVNYQQFGGELKIPVVLKNSDALIFGFEYNNLSIQSRFKETSTKEVLHESKFFAGIKHNWNSKWSTLALYVSKLNGDYKQINKSSLQHGALILNSFSKTENFELKFGAYYNAELFGPMLVPLLGWNWKINDNWRFKGIVPVNLEVIYSRPKSNYGLLFIGKNASFFKQNLNGPSTYIDMADNNAWIYAEFNIAKNFYVHFRAGHSVLRKFRYFDDGQQMSLKVGPANVGDNRPESNLLFKDGLSFESKLIFRLPTN